MRPSARALRSPPVLFAAAAAAVGGAIQFHDGEYRPDAGGAAAIGLITLAIVAAATAVAGPRGLGPHRHLIGRGFEPLLGLTPSPPYSGERAGVRGRTAETAQGPKEHQANPAGGLGAQQGSQDSTSLPLTLTLSPEYDSTELVEVRGEGTNPNPKTGAQPPRDLAVIGVLGILLAIQFTLLLTHRPDSREHPYLFPDGLAALGSYRAGLAVAALFAANGIIAAFLVDARLARLARLWFPAVLVAFVLLGATVLRETTRPNSDLDPRIDVFVFQQQASRALLHGRNPYAIEDYPDIYQSGKIDPATGRKHQEVYGPGMSDGRTLRFGFPYLPMSLYLATVGYGLAGDYRVAQLAALVAAAAFLYAARSGAASALAGVLLLFTPRIFFVLISGWTEPLLVLWMAAAVYCACRRPRLLPVALGLLLATKQYMALVLPLTVLLVPREPVANEGESSGWHDLLPRWREWFKLLLVAGLVAAATTLPLALWDWKRFYFSAVTVQQYAPFRWDALSYLTWHAFGHGPPSVRMTVLLPAFASALATALSLWRTPRTAAGFAGSAGLVLLVFFAFSKQAFANYYFFVIGAFCCAAAASGAAPRRRNAVPLPPAASQPEALR